VQSGNLLEVPGVQRRYRVPLLNRGSADQQIVSGKCDPCGRLLAADLSGNLRCAVGNRMHRDVPLQSSMKALRACLISGVLARHAVHEFSERDC